MIRSAALALAATLAALSGCASVSEEFASNSPPETFLDDGSVYIAQLMPLEARAIFCLVVEENRISCDDGAVAVGQGVRGAMFRTGNAPEAEREFQYIVFKQDMPLGRYALVQGSSVTQGAYSSRTVLIRPRDATVVFEARPYGVTLVSMSRYEIPSSFGVNEPDHLLSELRRDLPETGQVTVAEPMPVRLSCPRGKGRGDNADGCTVGEAIDTAVDLGKAGFPSWLDTFR